MLSLYKECRLCARNCGVDRTSGIGYCRMPSEMYIARAGIHKWEEPCISGTRGSGTIFFSGCSLSCIYCQNQEISRGRKGETVTVEYLSDIMLRMKEAKLHNVNLVTPTHYIPSIAEAIRLAKSKGFSLPVVYNTGSYDTPSSLKLLDGLVDVYLPDFKYYTGRSALAYSNAGDYPDVAKAALAEMYRQVGAPVFDGEGIMTRGMLVRILLLPMHVAEAKLSLKYLHDTYGDSVYVSLMNQYTPMPDMQPPLNRPIKHEEYSQLVEYAEKIGVINGFTQDYGTDNKSYIPPFDGIKI